MIPMNDKQRRAMFAGLQPYPSRSIFIKMLEREKGKPSAKPVGSIAEQNDPRIWTPTFDKYYHASGHAHAIARHHGVDKNTSYERAKSLEAFARKKQLSDQQLTDLLDLYHKDKGRE